MIDDTFILRVERLRDDVEELKRAIRRTYRDTGSQVASGALRDEARRLAEIWMVEVAANSEVRATVSPEAFADYNIAFQRLLTYSDRRSLRKLYEAAIQAILRDFRAQVIIPLKQQRNVPDSSPPVSASSQTPMPVKSVFVGHSFVDDDRKAVDLIVRFLKALGINVVTGEKPRAGSISAKVRERIAGAEGFLGIFTRREKIHGRDAWTTSAWTIDEKAFAVALGKKLILLREQGVDSIGGLQGDYEYLDFTRRDLAGLLVRLLELFREE